MHSKVTGGVVIEPIPIRVGGVKISTVFPIGERRGGLVCKIAKWMTGVQIPFLLKIKKKDIVSSKKSKIK